ncbi:cyclopropane-fatty-acyl-phospholipid synthase [Desulfacinum infernum DSM 9756]|uniref:Cyclopropane-fatty-acyl-phospholipid synthase n=1 Tax=Desulfacinum infernum DSM 9756 TaxID=1121391 RepID=A0A1M5FUX2_9BACT|nr:cyclopropane-fatty-acyl-phospholipid synthase [Desulfacinum infernum DSM 9756]
MKTIRPSLFDAAVEHRRREPVEHAFRYPLRLFGFDLEELPHIARRLPLFGLNRWNLLSIHDRDYLDPGDAPIREKLERHLRSAGLDASPARVVLVTSSRHLTRVFNPVSFYFFFDVHENWIGMAAEVNNTFGERHLYVLTNPESDSQEGLHRYYTDKAFHVSPFHDMEGRYEFLVRDIRKGLDIRIRLLKEGRVVFEAHLEGRPVPLTSANLLKDLARRPAVAHKTMPRILREAYHLYRDHKLPVYAKPAARDAWTLIKNPPSPLDRRLQSWLFHLFNHIQVGFLTVRLPHGSVRSFGRSGTEPSVEIQVHDPGFFRRVFFGGDVGLGESFMDGAWETSDLTGFITLLILNRDRLEDRQSTLSRLLSFLNRWRHLARANTLPGAKRNIRRHYDLSNELFEAFLDKSMTYSCAVFEREDEDLETAQLRKLRRIIRKARLGPDDHVLEIGCGWGGFALLAAREIGCRVTGITVSEAQRRLATERIRRAGLQDRVTILLSDYRKVRGRFDKIVSIEMLEAVGHEYYSDFFACCERLLAPHGRWCSKPSPSPIFDMKVTEGAATGSKNTSFPGACCRL